MRRARLRKRHFLGMNSWKLLADKERKMKSEGWRGNEALERQEGWKGGRAAVNAAERKGRVFFFFVFLLSSSDHPVWVPGPSVPFSRIRCFSRLHTGVCSQSVCERMESKMRCLPARQRPCCCEGFQKHSLNNDRWLSDSSANGFQVAENGPEFLLK